jgi:DNA polymerase
MLDPRALESLLAFWADAGVEVSYADAPVDRTAEVAQILKPAAPVRAAQTPRPPAAIFTPAGARPTESAIDLTEARRMAEAAVDLAALEAAIAAYDGCALKTAGATRAVFSRGNPEGPVMIIGEGPGADEDAQGAPFVGRAGKLLDKMIAAAELKGRVFITNTVFWRPPGNRTPTPAEQLACRPFVERAIALVNPKILVFAGAAAAKSMLGTTEGILSLHGRWFEWAPSGGGAPIPALPTLHPAFLLRQPGAKKKAWEDLLTLTSRLDRPERPG